MGNAALALRLELPYTQSFDTVRSSAAIEGLYSADLASTLTLQGRLTALGMVASSEAGATHRLAFRAGADLVWQRRIVSYQAGANLMAGWVARLRRRARARRRALGGHRSVALALGSRLATRWLGANERDRRPRGHPRSLNQRATLGAVPPVDDVKAASLRSLRRSRAIRTRCRRSIANKATTSRTKSVVTPTLLRESP